MPVSGGLETGQDTQQRGLTGPVQPEQHTTATTL